MIREFAFDPACAPSVESFRRVADQCALHFGRIISDFPRSRWALMVRDHFKLGSYLEHQQLTECLAQLARRGGLIDMARRFENRSWIDNALRENASRPFHCIITGPDGAHANSIDISQLAPNTPHWNVETEDRIPRSAERIVECVLPLIRQSRELLLVDPHLAPDTARYQRSVSAILEAAHADGKRYDRLELHSKLLSDPRNDDATRTRAAQQFEDDCRKFLPRHIPRGTELSVFLWDEIPNGDEFHVRLVLTERGGIRIDKGLDLGEPGQTTDIGLVAPGVYQKRWRDFQRGAMTFTLKREIRLVGTRR